MSLTRRLNETLKSVGEDRFGQKIHLLAALMVLLGSWLSGSFIAMTQRRLITILLPNH
jgi:hypothetical protein